MPNPKKIATRPEIPAEGAAYHKGDWITCDLCGEEFEAEADEDDTEIINGGDWMERAREDPNVEIRTISACPACSEVLKDMVVKPS